MPVVQVLPEHWEGWVHSVLRESAVQPALRVRPVLQERLVPLVLGELVAKLVPRVPVVQVLPEHLEGWVHLVPREPSALEEPAMQTALRVRPMRPELVPIRSGCGWRKWGRRQAGRQWCPRTFGGAPG